MHDLSEAAIRKEYLDRIEELEAENKRLRLEAAHANDTADAAIERAKAEADHNEPALTLDIDEYGIWLIEEALHGEKTVTAKQLGHVSWKQVAAYVQKPLAELKGQDDD